MLTSLWFLLLQFVMWVIPAFVPVFWSLPWLNAG
jgi:hypothetical protein